MLSQNLTAQCPYEQIFIKSARKALESDLKKCSEHGKVNLHLLMITYQICVIRGDYSAISGHENTFQWIIPEIVIV